MKDGKAFTIILIEEIAIIILGLCGLLAMAAFYFRSEQVSIIVLEPTQAPIVQYVVATSQPIPTITLRSAPTPFPTSTPPPWTVLTQCAVIDKPGEYRVGTDLVANGNCVEIQASDVLLDCMGHSIRGTGYKDNGIIVRKYGTLASQIPERVEIRNCHISQFHNGIYVESASALSIHGNDSSNNFDDVERGSRYGIFLGMTDGAGIRLNNVSNSQVYSNTTKQQAIGIDVRNSAQVMVRGNTSSENSAWGINLLTTRDSQVTNNTVADNIRQCTWGNGEMGYGCDAGGIILQDNSSNNQVIKNLVTGKNGNGIFIKAHGYPCGNNNTIGGNTIVGAMYNSVELGFCTGNKVNNNELRDGLDGVWLGFAHDNEIKDNTIVNMKNHGITSSNSRNNMVSGNRISNSNEGIFFYSESYDRSYFYWLPQDDYRSEGNCLCSNTFQSNKVGVHLKDSTHNEVINNIFQSNARNILVQGNNRGNNTDGNVGYIIPSLHRNLVFFVPRVFAPFAGVQF